jgi:hypothetical protein
VSAGLYLVFLFAPAPGRRRPYPHPRTEMYSWPQRLCLLGRYLYVAIGSALEATSCLITRLSASFVHTRTRNVLHASFAAPAVVPAEAVHEAEAAVRSMKRGVDADVAGTEGMRRQSSSRHPSLMLLFSPASSKRCTDASAEAVRRPIFQHQPQ